MSDRGDWLDARRDFVCGSDVAAIMGIDPWGGTAYDVACDKLGLISEPKQTEAQEIGLLQEETTATLYERRTGAKVYREPYFLWASDTVPFVAASVDGVTELPDGTMIGFESKNVGHYARWWPDTETVPLHVEMQAQWYMMVTGLDRWDVAVLFGGSTFCYYAVTADFWIQSAMLTAAADFWEYVKRGDLPEPVTLDNARHAAARKERTGALRWCNAEEEAAAAEYFDAVTVADFASAKVDAAKAALIKAIGPDSGIEGSGWHVTYKQNKAGRWTFRAESK